MKKGYRFGVYGGNAQGEILGVSGNDVLYRYDHDTETPHAMDKRDLAKISFPLTTETSTREKLAQIKMAGK